MRYGALGQNGAATVTKEQSPSAPPVVKEIPYDYVATFKLTGIAGHRVQDVITVSTEGTFIAVAIGYSFLPKLASGTGIYFTVPTTSATAISVPALPTSATASVTATLPTTIAGGSPPDGFPLGLFQGLPQAAFTPSQGSPSAAELLARTLLAARFKELCGIDFKYSVVDTGTGRELQNQPIHNIAGLGRADGDRPFRPFARPALFMPRSSIRIEIEEVSEGFIYTDGLLYIVLHGYKRLGE